VKNHSIKRVANGRGGEVGGEKSLTPHLQNVAYLAHCREFGDVPSALGYVVWKQMRVMGLVR